MVEPQARRRQALEVLLSVSFASTFGPALSVRLRLGLQVDFLERELGQLRIGIARILLTGFRRPSDLQERPPAGDRNRGPCDIA